MNRTTQAMTDTVADWMVDQTPEPQHLLALYRSMFDADADARAVLGYRLPGIAAELLPHAEGPLGALLARALSGVDWQKVADALADRWTRTESRALLRAGLAGMRVRQVRRDLARAG